MNGIINIYNKSTSFALKNGVEIIRVDKGYCEATIKVTKEHLNSFGTMHGGMIFTLADTAFGAAVNSHNKKAILSQASISYFKKVEANEKLKAIAREVFLGRKMASYTVEVLNSEEEKIALFQGTAYRFD